MAGEGEVVERTSRPVTPARIAAELRALGVAAGDTLLVHTSLSKLGWVPGGAQGVLEGLIEALGPAGTLVMPAFTGGNSDPVNWNHPPVPAAWFAEIRASTPPYDPRKSPTRMMGLINEAFRSWPGAIRSAHPQTSFAALGPRAAQIIEPHALEHALDDGSPLGRLCEANAKVLFLGTGYVNCTCFHLAEHRAGKIKRRAVSGAAILVAGERRWVEFEDWDFDSDDFYRAGEAFERSRRAVSIGKVGEAECRLFPINAAVDFAVRWFEQNRA